MSQTAALPRRRARITPRALVLIGIILALMVAISYPVRQYLHGRAEVQALEERADELARSNAMLRAEVQRLQDPEYIEYLARKCLGMVKAGEIAFVTVPGDGELGIPDC